jgi:hypothetical protein
MTVNFMDHTPLLLSSFLKAANKLKAENPIEAAFTACCTFHKAPGVMCGLLEKRFIRKGRPFFNVYPSVLSAISRTNISIRPSSIETSIVHELKTISIRIPTECETSKRIGMSCFILTVLDEESMDNLKQGGCPDIYGVQNRPCIVCHGIANNEQGNHLMFSTCPMDGTFMDADFADGCSAKQKDISHLVCRIALGVMMLAADPDYIKPVLLKADEGKTSPLEERIARAKRRGVFGFSIGEDAERSPHFRRPHFAIRWTGKGAEIPKLVPVKGAIVGKEKMTTVPTGYEESP